MADKLSKGALKTMYCVGYCGYNDEWYPNNDYIMYLKLDKHYYSVSISKRKDNWWDLHIYLCLTDCNSNDILIASEYAITMKKLQERAIDIINNYHNSDKCNADIERWKRVHTSWEE